MIALDKKEASSYFLLPFFSLIIFLISLYFENILLTIVFIWFFALLCIWVYNKNQFIDPRAVVPPFIAFYQSWYALSILLGREPRLFSMDLELLFESLSFSLFSLVVFVNACNLTFVFFNKPIHSYNTRPVSRKINFSRMGEIYIMLISSIISFFSVMYLLMQGVSSKNEASQLGGIVSIGYLFTLLLTIGVIIRVVRLPVNRIFKDPLVIGFIIYSFVYMLFLGERDIIFRFLVVIIFVFGYKTRKLTFSRVLVFLSVISIVIPISQFFKAVLLSESMEFFFTSGSIFGNEFISAGRNLYTLILFNVEYQPSSILNDVVRAFLPSTISDLFSVTSTNVWFNNVFRFENGFSGSAGWGFGLIPQAYLTGSFSLGGFFIAINAFILCLLFLRQEQSEYFRIFYFLSLAIFIYSLRADFSNFFSQTFKITGSMMILYMISNGLFRKCHEST